MGTAAHAVLEAAYRGEFSGASDPRGAALDLWDGLIIKLAGRLSGAQEPSRWRDYQLKRLRAAARATAIATGTSTASIGDRTSPSTHVEHRLRSADGRLVGQPDRVEIRGGHVTVVDLKTAAIDPGDLPVAYRQQLQLYSWLWHETSGEWPADAAIELLDGTRLPVEIVPVECDALADEALAALGSFNRLVESGADFIELAEPGIEQCRYCVFRGGCPRFLSEASEDWRSFRFVIGGRLHEDSGGEGNERCLTIAAEYGTAGRDGRDIRIRGVFEGHQLRPNTFIVADRVLAEVALHDYWADADSLIWVWDEDMVGRFHSPLRR